MNYKKYIVSFLLFLGFALNLHAFGIFNRTPILLPETSLEDNLLDIETESFDNIVILVQEITGYENIIEVYGETDITKLIGLQRLAATNEKDSLGRRYFTYTPQLRQDPVSMSDRRMDIRFYMADMESNYTLIAIREESIISYVVDEGNDSYRYGMLYFLSAIPVKNTKTGTETGDISTGR